MENLEKAMGFFEASQTSYRGLAAHLSSGCPCFDPDELDKPTMHREWIYSRAQFAIIPSLESSYDLQFGSCIHAINGLDFGATWHTRVSSLLQT